MRGHDKWLPHLLGHEASGIVVEVGEGVKKVKEGDEVILSWIKSDGLEAEKIKFETDDGIINAGPISTFSIIQLFQRIDWFINRKNSL